MTDKGLDDQMPADTVAKHMPIHLPFAGLRARARGCAGRQDASRATRAR
jgi:hypothetical protein